MIDAADFKQYIFPLLFFKRISDLWDEEYQSALEESGDDFNYAKFKENHRFQIPEGCHWEDVRKKTMNVGAALHKALSGIEKANDETRELVRQQTETLKKLKQKLLNEILGG